MPNLPPMTLDVLPPVLLDRSTLQAYSECPYKGMALETGLVPSGNLMTVSGQAVHDVAAFVVGECVQHDNLVERQEAMDFARMTDRTDVQQDVLDACKPFVSGLRWWLKDRNPADILRHDGGEGERSGQLAADLLPATKARGPIRLTSELDLLVATKADTVLDEIDFKSGRKGFTIEDIATSFQFRLHCWLVMANYPDVQVLRVSVWHTRKGRRTPPVTFTRRDAQDAEGMLLKAWEGREGTSREGVEVPTWPDSGKCSWCPCLLDGCPHPSRLAYELEKDPAAFACDTNLMRVMVEEREKQQDRHVDAKGPIEGEGWSYARHKPKPRKPAGKYKETKE